MASAMAKSNALYLSGNLLVIKDHGNAFDSHEMRGGSIEAGIEGENHG